MVASGGGGQQVMWLAKNKPSQVASVSWVEVYPPGIEFDYYAQQNSLSKQQETDYRNTDLASRASLAKLILYMAIPWGLMSLFVPLQP